MDLPFKKHFGVDCKLCGSSSLVAVTEEQVALDDPALILRSLNEEDRSAISAFYIDHQEHGAIPCLMGLAPMPEA